MPKTLTREQLEGRKEKAVRFVANVLDDPERANEIDDESLEDYATRRKIQIMENPHGGSMAKIRIYNPRRAPNPRRHAIQTNPQDGRTELLARIRELQGENDQLQDTLDKVADLAAAPEDNQDETHDELVDKLNSIIDTVAPPENGDDDQGDDEGND